MKCNAVQFSDQMVCGCGNVWDVNDPYPPECRNPPESGARGMSAGGEGMTLRDYFAAKAAGAVWASLSDMPADSAARLTAKFAYEIADAMLKEREK